MFNLAGEVGDSTFVIALVFGHNGAGPIGGGKGTPKSLAAESEVDVEMAGRILLQ